MNTKTNTIKFKANGFGMHTAITENGRYVIQPVAYDHRGVPKYGYTAVHVALVNGAKATVTALTRRGSFAECRTACKTHAQNI